MKIKAQLMTCGRCGKPKGNPLTHVCVTRMDKPQRPGKTKLKPKLSVTTRCPKCKRSYSNPLTHTCTVKTDFRQRLKASKRKPAPKKDSHKPAACKDGSCGRVGCEAYRDGYSDGFSDGMGAGS